MPLIRVLEIPAGTGNFHFDGGEPQAFIEVDWFRDDQDSAAGADIPSMATVEGREQYAEFIRGKRYFNPAKSYLVLHQDHTFTIGYSAP